MNIELAKRAVACKGWRWLDGCRVFGGATIVDGDTLSLVVSGENFVRSPESGSVQPIPDLDHPATLGCLTALVREAWSEPCLGVVCLEHTPGDMRWGVRSYGRWLDSYALPGDPPDGATEAEALVAALEAAPC